jgi:transcriptional regulator of arginine metabolism
MTKTYRHGQILKLVRSRSIFTQDELARALAAEGVETTQVTLSRDMRELRLVKTGEGYREIERVTSTPAGPTFDTLAAEFLRDVRKAQNQVVIRTAPGHANSVAVALDGEEWSEVVGTIAGDDTVLVICPDSPTAESVRKKLIALIES